MKKQRKKERKNENNNTEKCGNYEFITILPPNEYVQ